jgi:hypothetical protein
MQGSDTRAARRRQSRSAITRETRTIGSAARLSRAALVVAPPVRGGFIEAIPKRLLILATAGAAPAITAGPAAAIDNPTPGVNPGACVDHVKPTSGFTAKAERRAARKRILRGTTHWSFRLPNGRYVIQTRAIDFAGNVRRSHTRRLRLR